MHVPNIKVTPPGPRAQAILERDRAVVSPSYPRCAPFVMARGEGAVVEDVDGNIYLDCCAGIAVNATGYSHPDVVRAITDQVSRFVHISTDYYHEPQVELAEVIVEICARRGTCENVLLEFRHRGRRSGHQAGAPSHPSSQHHRVPRIVSWPHAGVALIDSQPDSAAERFRAYGSWRLPRAVRKSLSLSGRA